MEAAVVAVSQDETGEGDGERRGETCMADYV